MLFVSADFTKGSNRTASSWSFPNRLLTSGDKLQLKCGKSVVLPLTDPQDPHESHFTSKMKLYEEFSHGETYVLPLYSQQNLICCFLKQCDLNRQI